MKKLKKISFSEIEERYQILNTIELSDILGGGGRTDCYFLCMSYINNDYGGKVSSQRYQDLFVENYDQEGAKGPDGAKPAAAYFKERFDVYGDNVGDEGYTPQQTIDAVKNGAKVIGAFSKDGQPHAIILKSYIGDFGTYEYYDPQSNTTGFIHSASISFAIGAKGLKKK